MSAYVKMDGCAMPVKPEVHPPLIGAPLDDGLTPAERRIKADAEFVAAVPYRVRYALIEALEKEGAEAVFNRLVGRRARTPLPQQRRAQVIARDNATCQYCGATGVKLVVDHVNPVVAGGNDEIDNLTTACVACNAAKGARPGRRCECGRMTWEGGYPHKCGATNWIDSQGLWPCHDCRGHEGQHMTIDGYRHDLMPCPKTR